MAAGALCLCLGFGGGYIARDSFHLGSGGGTSAGIRPTQEFVSVLTFCAHLNALPAIEVAIAKGRSADARRRLANLAHTIAGDANLFDAAQDAETAKWLRQRAEDLPTSTTLVKLHHVRDALEGVCNELRVKHPPPSKPADQ